MVAGTVHFTLRYINLFYEIFAKVFHKSKAAILSIKFYHYILNMSIKNAVYLAKKHKKETSNEVSFENKLKIKRVQQLRQLQQV